MSPADAAADATARALPFSQSWSSTATIARDDDWSGVRGLVGHRGDGLVEAAGTDPRSVLADGAATPVDVNANETDPRAVGLAAGVAEFELADPVVALQGSATADAPHLVLSIDTTDRTNVTISYVLRDVDASTNGDAVQPVALQYRLGRSGAFANVAGGFVPDATTGPGEATLRTPVSARLPAAVDDRPLVEVRVITTDAAGRDEWVGVDDLLVTGAVKEEPAAGGPAAGGPAGGGPAGGGPTGGNEPGGQPGRLGRLAADPVRLEHLAVIPWHRECRAWVVLSVSAPSVVRLSIATTGGERARRLRRRVPSGITVIGAGLRRLAPGPYRIRVVATDAAGNRSAPRRARFRIRRARPPLGARPPARPCRARR